MKVDEKTKTIPIKRDKDRLTFPNIHIHEDIEDEFIGEVMGKW